MSYFQLVLCLHVFNEHFFKEQALYYYRETKRTTRREAFTCLFKNVYSL